jgi:hypothetical protein
MSVRVRSAADIRAKPVADAICAGDRREAVLAEFPHWHFLRHLTLSRCSLIP